MARRSLPHLLTALCAIASLVFAQVAMAAFVPPTAIAQMAVETVAEGGCHEADPGPKHVCIKACEAQPQKHEAPLLAALPPALDPGLRIEAAAPVALHSREASDPFLARSGAPPPRLLFARFLK